jgi:hypothetical protein
MTDWPAEIVADAVESPNVKSGVHCAFAAVRIGGVIDAVCPEPQPWRMRTRTLETITAQLKRKCAMAHLMPAPPRHPMFRRNMKKQ